jgi:hypothetical protein
MTGSGGIPMARSRLFYTKLGHVGWPEAKDESLKSLEL